MLQSSSGGNIFNLVGIAILIVYIYFHAEYRRASSQTVETQSRRRATAALLGFMFYAVVVGMYGPSTTWVAPLGTAINSYFERLAGEAVGFGQTGTGGTVGQTASFLQTLGLAAYFVAFSTLAISNGITKKVAQFIADLVN